MWDAASGVLERHIYQSRFAPRPGVQRLSFRKLIVCITFLAVLTMALRVSIDTDTWWHLRAGEWMVEHGAILRTDPFSLTRLGQAWVNPGWLAQILLYGIYRLGGFPALNAFTALMVLVAFTFAWSIMEAPVTLRAFVLLLAVTVSGVYWAVRPYILSFALAGAFLYVLEGHRRGRRKLIWLLPPLMALWVNLHGGFAVGFLLLGAYGVGALLELFWPVFRHKQSLTESWTADRGQVGGLWAAFGASMLAAGLNPHGFAILLYPFQTVSIGALQDFIQEWQSPDFHQLHVQPFLWMLLLTMIAWAYSRRRVRPSELFLVAGFAYLSLMAGRNIALFALVAAPSLARHAQGALEPYIKLNLRPDSAYPPRLRMVNVLLFGLLLLAAGVKMSIPLRAEENQDAIRGFAPVAAARALKQEAPPGELFNSYNWGGYLIWDAYPQYLTFVDGRTDLFDDEILNAYLLAWRAEPGWLEVFQDWDIHVALIESDAPLRDALLGVGWIERYSDEQAVILTGDLGGME
jgi:hypothetical protein